MVFDPSVTSFFCHFLCFPPPPPESFLCFPDCAVAKDLNRAFILLDSSLLFVVVSSFFFCNVFHLVSPQFKDNQIMTVRICISCVFFGTRWSVSVSWNPISNLSPFAVCWQSSSFTEFMSKKKVATH